MSNELCSQNPFSTRITRDLEDVNFPIFGGNTEQLGGGGGRVRMWGKDCIVKAAADVDRVKERHRLDNKL